MTEEQYKQLLGEIEKEIDSERERIEITLSERREHLIESVNTTWKLANKTEPPSPSYLVLSSDSGKTSEDINIISRFLVEQVQQNGNDLNRNAKIRNVVRNFHRWDIITTETILEMLQRYYPEIVPELHNRKTIISKVCREMVRKGEIRKTKEAAGNKFAEYVKL